MTDSCLDFRCDNEPSCHLPVNSHIFGGDPCAGTRKYLEVHYECVDSSGGGGGRTGNRQSGRGPGGQTPNLPPWLYDHGALDLWQEEEDDLSVGGLGDGDDGADSDESESFSGRKPILVQAVTTTATTMRTTTTTTPVRIPITTPKPTVAPRDMDNDKADDENGRTQSLLVLFCHPIKSFKDQTF